LSASSTPRCSRRAVRLRPILQKSNCGGRRQHNAVLARRRCWTCTNTTPLLSISPPARPEARHRHVVDFSKRGPGRIGARIDPDDRAGARTQRPPHGAVGGAHHHRTEHLCDPLVLGGIDRLVGLDIVVALAVAVGVEDQRRPALRVVGVLGEVQVVGGEAGCDAAALLRIAGAGVRIGDPGPAGTGGSAMGPSTGRVEEGARPHTAQAARGAGLADSQVEKDAALIAVKRSGPVWP
jgi:hypothetical protein